MENIKFTSGTLSKDCSEYCTLTLFHGEKKVYAATLPMDEAIQVMNDYNNIKLIK